VGDPHYVIGALQVRAEAWPEPWIRFADTTWRRVEGSTLPTVAVTLGQLPTPGRDEGAIVVDDLDVSVDDAGCAVTSGDAFSARYDHAERRLHIDVFAHLGVPRIILGNAVRGMISYRLPVHDDGLMIHSCSGVLDGCGVVVAGVSTAGKTTLAQGMRRTRYLSDDISLVAALGGDPALLPSPFFGIEGTRGDDEGGPLKAVAVMEKRLEGPTVVTRLSAGEGMRGFTRHVVCWSKDASLQRAILERIASLGERVPFVHVARSLGESSDDVMSRVLEVANA
jgi:hypothetical protein